MIPDTPEIRRVPSAGAMRRIGTLTASGWRTKLYAPAADAPGLRREDVAAAGRAYRAGVADPGLSPVVGFALLSRGCRDGDLALSVFWWEAETLLRSDVGLPGTGAPGRGRERHASQVGEVDALLLMGREARAWRRCVLEAESPSPDAYLAECCA